MTSQDKDKNSHGERFIGELAALVNGDLITVKEICAATGTSNTGTVYGMLHNAADTSAGFLISLIQNLPPARDAARTRLLALLGPRVALAPAVAAELMDGRTVGHLALQVCRLGLIVHDQVERPVERALGSPLDAMATLKEMRLYIDAAQARLQREIDTNPRRPARIAERVESARGSSHGVERSTIRPGTLDVTG